MSCPTCGSTKTIDHGTACAQCGCDLPPDKPRTCATCFWAEKCTDGLYCAEREKPTEPGETCSHHATPREVRDN